MESYAGIVRRRFDVLTATAFKEKWRPVHHYRQLRDVEQDCKALLYRSRSLDSDMLKVLAEILAVEKTILVGLIHTDFMNKLFYLPSLWRVERDMRRVAHHHP